MTDTDTLIAGLAKVLQATHERIEVLERAVVDHVLLWDHTIDDPTFLANVEHSVARLRELVGSDLADVKAGIDPWQDIPR